MEMIGNLLKTFHFTESEAKVYLSLLSNGASTGYEISKLSGVPRSKIYNILEQLSQKGAVYSSHIDKTKEYMAVSIEDLVEILREQTEAKLKTLQEKSSQIASPINDERIWHIDKWEAVKRKCIQLIENAKEHVAIQVWSDDLDESLEKTLIDKQDEIKKVAVILYDLKKEYKTKLKHCYRHGFEENKLKEMGGRWLLLEVDSHSMVYVFIGQNGIQESFFTANQSFSLFAREYIFHDAYCLRLIDRLHEHVVSEFGVDMEDIRNIYSI